MVADGGGVGERRVARLAEAAALMAVVERLRAGGTRDARAVRRALEELARQPIVDAAMLVRFHEALCFMRAYPVDAAVLQSVETALHRFPERVAEARAAGARAVEALDETGIGGTTVYCPLSYRAAGWLVNRFPGAVEIDWDDAGNDERLGAMLPFAAGLAEEEALVEAGAAFRAWLVAARGTSSGSDLQWLLAQLDRRPMEAAVRRALYDGVQLRVRWELRDNPASRTLAHVAVGPVVFARGRAPRWRGSLVRRLPGPRVPVRRASRALAAALIDAARAAVTVRYREVHAFNFADAADVLVADLGRGVAIAWMGLLPEHRLPIRAHYGYLVLKNGVPIGYGDASLLLEQVEVAYNVFETFRSAESAFILGRLLGFLHQRFRARRFCLSPYQIGRDNDEALASGAFWFYDKLGFRPERPDLRALAAAERRRIKADRGHRSSRATLARLSEGAMVLSTGQRVPRTLDARALGLRALASVGAEGAGEAAAAIARSLGVRDMPRWSPAERNAFARFAPVLALVPDLADWPAADRRAVTEVVRAKGRPREDEYLRRLRGHRRLREALERLASPAPSARRPRDDLVHPRG